MSAVQDLIDKHISGDPAREASFSQAKREADIARCVYDIRTAAGLDQTQLAALVGCPRWVISDLEDADYDGDSEACLRAISEAVEEKNAMIDKEKAAKIAVAIFGAIVLTTVTLAVGTLVAAALEEDT